MRNGESQTKNSNLLAGIEGLIDLAAATVVAARLGGALTCNYRLIFVYGRALEILKNQKFHRDAKTMKIAY